MIAAASVRRWCEAQRVADGKRWSGEACDTTLSLDLSAGDCLEIRARLRREPGGAVALTVARHASGAGIPIVWQGDLLTVGGHGIHLASGNEFELHAVIDRTTVEVFADGGRSVVTRVVQRDQRGEGLTLAVAGAISGVIEWWALAACRQ